MLNTNTGKRTNKNFEAAMSYVKANYAEMLHPSLGSIKLVPVDGRAWGRFWSFTVRRDPATGMLTKIQTPVITIADGRRPVYEFVNTIVHELTHLAQHVEGRKMCEIEAHSAGNHAAYVYNQKRLAA